MPSARQAEKSVAAKAGWASRTCAAISASPSAGPLAGSPEHTVSASTRFSAVRSIEPPGECSVTSKRRRGEPACRPSAASLHDLVVGNAVRAGRAELHDRDSRTAGQHLLHQRGGKQDRRYGGVCPGDRLFVHTLT